MYRTILLAYDGSREGRLALREGARLAQTCGARVVLLAIVEPRVDYGLAVDPGVGYIPMEENDDYKKILDEGVERLTRLGLVPEARLETGMPAERITAVAQEVKADLVVVGHHKQGLMARWLRGSVTASLSDSLSCSLLVARLEISDDVLFAQAAAVPGQPNVA
jgi:nucleotide-binding universal stress UspA family protein